jgi:hypothetical protein
MQLSVCDPQRLAGSQHRLDDPLQHCLPGNQLPNPRHKPGFADLAHLQSEPAQVSVPDEFSLNVPIENSLIGV